MVALLQLVERVSHWMSMQLHASCAARDGNGVLIVGASGSGKSDLVLRLIDAGFTLVADDQVELGADGRARPPPRLAGLVEVRGFGIVRLPYLASARLVLAVTLGELSARLPEPASHAATGLPLIAIDARAHSAVARIALALDCIGGRVPMLAGAFA